MGDFTLKLKPTRPTTDLKLAAVIVGDGQSVVADLQGADYVTLSPSCRAHGDQNLKL